MRLFLIAFQFLTIIPLPCDTRCGRDDLGRATACFPLVGLLIGALLCGAEFLLAPYLAVGPRSALLVTLLAALTGALHLDGLADVCDGLAARGDRERFLAVMKDSRVGAVGVVGIVLGVLLKWQALATLPAGLRWQALLLFPLVSRFAMVAAMSGARHARQEGLGAAFIGGMGWLQLFFALLFTLAAVLLLVPAQGIAALCGVTVTALAVRWYFTRRLGGLTGDIVGCICEVGEITTLLIVAAA